MMYHALDIGLTVDEFWRMTPRAIILLQQELNKSVARAGGGTGKTVGGAVMRGGAMPLSMLPRP